jgi:hypothetical protein
MGCGAQLACRWPWSFGRRRSSREPAAILPSVTRRGAATSRKAGPKSDELDAAILRYLRRTPNSYVALDPLAEELGVEPFTVQLAVERLARRGMVVLPFIEPTTAGGAILAEEGLRWLVEREGGKPRDVPVAYQLAKKRVRALDEAARLPRAQVYGKGS